MCAYEGVCIRVICQFPDFGTFGLTYCKEITLK